MANGYQLRQEMPNVPLINDPSHITGNRELVYNVAQTALDLNFDGLMIETHLDPDNAWSDAAQQVTPEQLSLIMNRLIVRNELPEGAELKDIKELRDSINYIDNQILDLLNYRMTVSKDIASFKQRHNMTVFQEGRWKELLAAHQERGADLGLSKKFISKVYHAIHQESIDHQVNVINQEQEVNA